MMTMREELIEGGAKAWWGAMADEHNSWDTLGADEKAELCVGAAASLDAFLAILEDPNEEMVEAGVMAMRNGGGDGDAVFDAFRAMLKPLKGDAAPRPADPGIPVYRLRAEHMTFSGHPTDQASWSPERIKQEEARQAALLAEQERKP